MADTKASALTADASPTSDDLVYTVNDPGGTPASRKVTIANLAAAIDALARAANVDLSGGYGITYDLTNANAGAITIGEAVYVSTTNSVDLADSDAAATAYAIGLVADASIASSGSGAICFSGVVSGFDTSGLTVAQPFFVSGTAGALTSTQPTANAVPVGICLESHATTGKVLVNPTNLLLSQVVNGTILADSSSNEWIVAAIAASAVNYLEVGNSATGNAVDLKALGGDTDIDMALAAKGSGVVKGPLVPLTFAISDETTALTTGTAKLTYYMPRAFTIQEIYACVSTAPTGAALIIDVNDGGTSIMTTNKLSIDVSEFDTTTAATAPTLTDTALAAGAALTFDIDQIGSTVAGAGAKVTLLGYWT